MKTLALIVLVLLLCGVPFDNLGLPALAFWLLLSPTSRKDASRT